MVSQSDKICINAVKVLLACTAIITNMTLIVITVKAKNLHGRCSILIAANSVSIIFYSFTFFTQLLMSIFDPTAQGIPASRCLAYMAVPLFFSNCQFVLFPTIALDRLLGALFPLWQLAFLQPRKKLYLCIVFCIVGVYAGFIIAVSFVESVVTNPTKLVLCMTGDPAPSYYPYFTIVWNCSSAVVYVILYVKIKLWSNQEVSPSVAFTRRILNSLMTIFLAELFGWVSNTVVHNALNWMNVLGDTQWYIMSVVGYFMQIALAMNPVILFILSPEYHEAFTLVVRRMKNNAIFPGSSNPPAPALAQQHQRQTNNQQQQQNINHHSQPLFLARRNNVCASTTATNPND